MSVSIDEERGELLERYHDCSPTDQAAVKLLAVSRGGLSKSQITTALRKILSSGEANWIKWDPLQRSGLIENQKTLSGGQPCGCNTLIAEPVTRELVESGAFEAYVGLVRLAAPLQPTYLKTAKDDIQFRDDDELIRKVRIGMCRGDITYIDQVFRMLQRMRFAYWNGLPATLARPRATARP